MRAEYNGAMGIPNNYQSFCEAHENGISLGFSLPILSQILIVLAYKGYLAFASDYLFNAKKIILFCLVGVLCPGPYCRETPQ